MARRLQDKTNVIPPDSNFPYGRVRNNSGIGDGTPVDESLVGDWSQFFERLLAIGSVVANGFPEGIANGFQYLTALLNIVNNAVSSEAAIRAAADTVLTNNKLDKSGGILSGPINMSGNPIYDVLSPTASDQAANRGYVDTKDSSEAAIRSAADSAEVTARTNADNLLQTNIDAAFGQFDVTNFNSITRATVTIANDSVTNSPGVGSGPYLLIVSKPPSSITTQQVAIKLSGTGLGGIYQRSNTSGTWSSWVLINNP